MTITLAENVPGHEVAEIATDHDEKHHSGWRTTQWHCKGIKGCWLIYDVYCLECEEEAV